MQQLVATTLARHESISVIDFRCTARVENTHSEASLSYVRSGSLRYQALGRTFDLVAGAILIGRPGVDYVCTHEGAGGGGECLSFRLGPALAELTCDRAMRHVGCVPPVAELMVLGQLAQAAAKRKVDVGLDEVGFLFASRLRETLSGNASHVARGTATDRRRAIDAAAWIEAHCDEAVDLEMAAGVAGIGSFHFLRTFSKVLGVTPHQVLGSMPVAARGAIAGRGYAIDQRNRPRCRVWRPLQLCADVPPRLGTFTTEVPRGRSARFGPPVGRLWGARQIAEWFDQVEFSPSSPCKASLRLAACPVKRGREQKEKHQMTNTATREEILGESALGCMSAETRERTAELPRRVPKSSTGGSCGPRCRRLRTRERGRFAACRQSGLSGDLARHRRSSGQTLRA